MSSDSLSSDLASLKISRDVRPPRKSPTWLIGVAAAGGVGWLAYAVGLPYLEAQVYKTEITVTEIAEVSPAQAAIDLTTTGYVVPEITSKIAPKVPGRVAKVAVRQGQVVAAGDVLFELDAADQDAAISAMRSHAGAAWATAKTAVAQARTAEARLAQVKIQADRQRALASQGVAPIAQAQDLEASFRSEEQAVQAATAVARAAQAQAAAAQADVRATEVNRNNLTLLAPISGTIINKPPEVGEFVGPQPAGVSVDMGGVHLADLKNLTVETDVPEQRLSLVKAGGPCEIVLDAFPGTRYRGRTVEITPEVNRSKATVKVKVKFLDDAPGVLPDMSARVSFLSKEIDAAAVKIPPKIIVPSSALGEHEGEKVVYVVDGDQVRRERVELGPAFGKGFELTRGPRPGTKVVREPKADMADGQRVKERTEE